MKILFIVQGEGREHLTQAIALEKMLLRKGHEVVEVLVDQSKSRHLPSFFNKQIQAPVKHLNIPNFLPSSVNKQADLGRSLIYNLLKTPEYIKNSLFLNKQIQLSQADLAINFYELLCGLIYSSTHPFLRFV